VFYKAHTKSYNHKEWAGEREKKEEEEENGAEKHHCHFSKSGDPFPF